MSLFIKNVLANFSGQVGAAVLNVLLVPFYIKSLGIEAYGLIGFFVSLQAVIFILDFGLSATTVREIAKRASAGPADQKEIPAILRTLECIYAGMGALVAVLVFLFSQVIATKWINAQNISIETIRSAIIIFGLITAFRWPIALYSGVLRGLEFQVIINIISSISIIIGAIGIIIILTFINKSITYFFAWQLVMSAFELGLIYFITWNKIPIKGKNNIYFDMNIIKSLWHFSSKVSLISIFAAILKQLDKLLIVKLVPLQLVGYYNIAGALTSGLYLFSLPITTAVFPKLISLYSHNKTTELAETYHCSAKLLSFLISCFSGIMFYFSYDILFLWTHSKEIAENTYQILSLLSLAALLNAMMHLPYMLQLASGLIWLPLLNNFIAVILLTPTIFILVHSIGIIGGAISWLLFNFFYFNIVPRIMHKYILLNQFRIWYYQDTLQFIVLSQIVFGLAFLIRHYFIVNVYVIPILIITSIIIFYIICYYKMNIGKAMNMLRSI